MNATSPLSDPTALIAEDEPLLARGLQAELARVWPALRIAGTAGDGEEAVRQALALQPTVCFLDIRMPGQSGLDAARAIVEDWPAGPALPLMVFVTAYDQYALQAYDVQAVDYVVKPVTPDRLAATVQRLQQRLQAPPAEALQQTLGQLRALLGTPAPPATVPPPRLEVIQAQVGAVVHFVPVDDVLYFEAADKYVRVVTAEPGPRGEHLIRLSLKELMPQLDPQRFWQVHRGTVVQARAILSARREESGKVLLTLRGRPETLVASRLYAHLFKGL
ncbi:MAG: response regulator transcription factor [Rubrivivax sp.]|jgi:DNA-binding LytR/AlgR family response regulator|nr:response regulator transcription factor [Rubrivivax sp.]